METSILYNLFASFESIVKTVDGVECWSARELYPLLGYTQWRGFSETIERAKQSCKSASGDILANCAVVRKIVKTGISTKEIDDILLTRYACFLVAQNGDPK